MIKCFAQGHENPKLFKVSAREQRALKALIKGPVMREQLDSIAMVSNGPDVIYRLRHRAGLTIHTERLRVVDHDGQIVMAGRYSLDPVSRMAALDLLEQNNDRTKKSRHRMQPGSGQNQTIAASFYRISAARKAGIYPPCRMA